MRLFRALAGFRHDNHERRCPSDIGCEVKTDKEWMGQRRCPRAWLSSRPSLLVVGGIAGRDQCKIDGEVRATKVEDRWRSARGLKR